MNAHHGGLILASILILASCTENAATGRQQFTGLMPSSQEASVGATEHEKAIAQYGLYKDAALQARVDAIGKRLVAHAERTDVTWTFTVLDSPVLNAFALPGGYVYVTRGLIAYANNEAELAGVMAHEIGHVVARHSAARYSQAAVANIGLQILSVAVKTPGLNQAAGLGANLYLSQYSQSQEYESDDLGIRYLTKAGYDPVAMSSFLRQLDRNAQYEAAHKGQSQGQGLNQFFASHPSTPARVTRARTTAQAANVKGELNRDAFLRSLDGLPFGDGAKDGYVQGNRFVHPVMGFAFDAPTGFTLQNSKTAVIGTHSSGTTMIFDMGKLSAGQSMTGYLESWTKGAAAGAEAITINGLPAATAQIAEGSLNGKRVSVRVVAIDAGGGAVYRMQYAIPPSLAANAGLQADVQSSARSFRLLSQSERNAIPVTRLRVVTAAANDTVDSLSSRMNVKAPDNKAALFRALNGLDQGQNVTAGQVYKIVQ